MKTPFLFSLMILFGFLPKVSACIWDRDTLKVEGEGIPDVIKTISGRFDRFPPRYYEMRRDRVLEEIQTDPTNLDLYDDLAVCYDRLGDATTAIDWMAKKKQQLDALAKQNADHQYRYLANLGTFYAHRWLKAGADLSKLEDIDRAEELVEAAIELNPDAHFGREKYQLQALQWIQSLAGQSKVTSIQTIHKTIEWGGVHTDPNSTASDAVTGFSGLITLGAAWQSYDIFMALSEALKEDSRNAIAELALLRAVEIDSNGGQSIASDLNVAYTGSLIENPAGIKTYYTKLRKEAKQWHLNRMSYMTAQFDQGLHPDTHPDFWVNYVEKTQPPKLPDSSPRNGYSDYFLWLAICAVGGLLAILLIQRMRYKTID